jgi:hypothetical protein
MNLPIALIMHSKARALEGLGRIEDAQAAIQDGLQFEPDNQVWRQLRDTRCTGD